MIPAKSKEMLPYRCNGCESSKNLICITGNKINYLLNENGQFDIKYAYTSFIALYEYDFL